MDEFSTPTKENLACERESMKQHLSREIILKQGSPASNACLLHSMAKHILRA